MRGIEKRDLEDSDNQGTDWTTCEDSQAAEDTPRSCERKSIPEASESGR